MSKKVKQKWSRNRLNIGELLIPIWHGTLKCELTDDKATWDWATLVGETWLTHGKLVAAQQNFSHHHFTALLETLRKKYLVVIKLQNIIFISSDLGLLFFELFFPKNTGRISASLCEAFISSCRGE